MIIAILKLIGGMFLLIVLLILLFVFGIINKLRRNGGGFRSFNMGGFGSTRPNGSTRTNFGSSNVFGSAASAERCPACHQVIVAGKDPGSCPKCGTLLGRNREGKLLIRIN